MNENSLLKRFGSTPVNVAALRGDVLQAKPPGQRQIGVDWVPPMASLSIIVPSKVSTAPSKRLRAAQMPKSFSWRNADDIAKAGKGKMVLGPVRNQLTCGSCWAVSASTALSHRVSIAQQATVELSETYIMACLKGTSQQCNGGFPLEAGEFFEKTGTVQRECFPYTWCENTPDCAQQGQGEAAQGSSGLIPACGDKCVECPDGGPNCAPTDMVPKLYKAKAGSTKQLVTIEDIKADLFTYGPTVGSYAVYADFLMAGQDNYAKTGNIYINRQKEASPYGGDASAPTQIMGFHAVTIVGWGEQEVEGFGTVPYWEVQNSWGEAWGDKGFWKHAMSDQTRDINWKVGMDIPATFDLGNGGSQTIGGATVFVPDMEYVPTNGGNGGGGNDNLNEFAEPTRMQIMLGWSLLAVLLLLVLTTFGFLMRCG